MVKAILFSGCLYFLSVYGLAQGTTAQLMTPQYDYKRAAELKNLQMYHATLLNNSERLEVQARQKKFNECGDQIREFWRSGTYPEVLKDGVYKVHVIVKNTMCNQDQMSVKDNKIEFEPEPGYLVTNQPIKNGSAKVLIRSPKGNSTLYEFYFIYQ